MESCLAETGLSFYGTAGAIGTLIVVSALFLARRRKRAMRFGGISGLAIVFGMSLSAVYTQPLYAAIDCEPPKTAATAMPDSSQGVQGATQVFNVLTNDSPAPGASFVLSTLELGLAPGYVLGSSVSDDRKTVTAPTEGVYRATENGAIAYQPEADFSGSAVGVSYSIKDTAGNVISSLYTPTVTPTGGPTACTETPEILALEARLLMVEYGEGATTLANTSEEYVRVAVSPQANYLVAAAEAIYGDNTKIYRSNNEGQSWQHVGDIPGDMMTSQLAISDNGQRIVVLGNDLASWTPKLAVSEDGGTTWNIKTPANSDSRWTLSINGSALLDYGAYGGATDLRVSTDDGVAWTDVAIPVGAQMGIQQAAVSDNGMNIVLLSTDSSWNTVVASSGDGGATWTETGASILGVDFIDVIAVSADGLTMIVTGWGDGDYTIQLNISTDGGVTWQSRLADPNLAGRTVRLANSGVIVAPIQSGIDELSLNTTSDDAAEMVPVMVSLDYGVTWTERTASEDLISNGVTLATDGTFLAGFNLMGRTVSISSDLGETWHDRLLKPLLFNPAHVDIDPGVSGQQLTINKSASEGWRAVYNPVSDVYTLTVTDFDRFMAQDDGGDISYPTISYNVVNPGCGYVIATGEVHPDLTSPF